MVEEDGAGGAGDGLIDIGIGEDEHGRFSAQFQGHLFEVAGSGLDDELADLRGAGEGDFIDKIVGGEGRACAFAIAGEDVDDAGREAGFIDELGPGAGRRAGFARLISE